MKNKLQRYFPIIRTRKEILNELRDNDELWSQFESWEEENQEEYLDICTAVGLKREDMKSRCWTIWKEM